MKTRKSVKAFAGAALATAFVLSAAPAHAATQTGWTGITAPSPDGVTFLHNSTVTNSPNLVASSKIWTTLGGAVGPFEMGARARLFKGSVLCQAVDYEYNFGTVSQTSTATSGHCGSGSYNSHGFVAVWNRDKGSYDQYVTFPTNGVGFTAPAAKTFAAEPDTAPVGKNKQGKSLGSARDIDKNGNGMPDLVRAYASNGKIGYVWSKDLDKKPASRQDAEASSRSAGRTIAVYDEDGTTKIGDFSIS